MTALAGRRVLLLPPEDIVPNPSQPRRIFEEDGLRELAESIRRWGVLQPLTVRRRGENWELVAGERRLRAAMLAGLAAVPCLPIEAEDTDSALLAVSDPEAQAAAAKHIRERQLSVAQAERYLAALPAQAAPRGRRSYILKDVRLFLNSVDRGLRVIREAGVDAQTERQETEDAIILTIRIPRGLPGKTVTGL